MDRQLISSGSPYEKSIGFSRAVRVGDRILLSGTAPISDDGSTFAPDNPFAQTRRCLEIIQKAIEEAGGTIKDVIRTRIYITDQSYSEEVGKAHGEVFSKIKPVSTMVVVKELLRPEWTVEIEAEAIVG